jgi:hypothetical protein
MHKGKRNNCRAPGDSRAIRFLNRMKGTMPAADPPGRLRRVVAALLLVGWAPALAAAGTVHVDALAENAADGNAGTEAEPLATLTAALDQARPLLLEGTDVTIAIGQGVYREALTLEIPTDASKTGTLTLRGSAPGQVILSGADIYDDWEIDGQRFVIDWPWARETPELPEEIRAAYARDDTPVPPLLLRREILFIRDETKTRSVRLPMVAPGGPIEPGTFFVLPEAAEIRMSPPNRYLVRPGSLRVSMPERACLLRVSGPARLKLENLEFRHAPGALGDRPAAVDIDGATHIAIADCLFEHNGCYGLRIRNTATVELDNIEVARNGLGGMLVTDCGSVRATGNVVRLNDWRGFEVGLTPVGAIGASFERNAALELRRCRYLDNKCDALHIAGRDEAVSQERLEGVYSVNNGGHALYLFSRDGEVADSVFALNVASVNLRGDIAMRRCVFWDNGPARLKPDLPIDKLFAQLNLFGGGMSEAPGDTSNITLSANIFANRNAVPHVGLYAWDALGADGPADTYAGTKNLFFTRGEAPARFRVADTTVSFPLWRELVSSDFDSIETDPVLSGVDQLSFTPGPTSPVYRKSRWPVHTQRSTPEAAWERVRSE